MGITREKARGIIRVPIEYFAFDQDDKPVMNGDDQATEEYVAYFRRRSDGESKDRKFHEDVDPQSHTILTDFCALVVRLEGFDDFPQCTEVTVGDVAFDYFNDPDMITYVERFMLGFQRRTLPVEFFRRISTGGVEVSGAQQAGDQAGA